jgi:hypothetical protein
VSLAGAHRHRPLAVALWLLAAVTGWGMAHESRRIFTSVGYARGTELPPAEWRLGSPPVRELEAFLHSAGSSLPAHRLVLFLPPPELGEASQFATLWAAYLHPGPTWIHGPDVGLDVPIEIVVCWRRPLDDPRFEPLLVEPHGGVYRRRR